MLMKKILFLFICLMPCFCIKAQNPREFSVKADCYDVETNEYAFQATMTLTHANNDLLILVISPYPPTPKGLGYFFNRYKYSSTWQTLNYRNAGDAWIISTLLSDEESKRWYLGFHLHNGEFKLYIYRKPYEDADPIYEKYYLKFNKSFVGEIMSNVLKNDNYYKVLESKGDYQ